MLGCLLNTQGTGYYFYDVFVFCSALIFEGGQQKNFTFFKNSVRLHFLGYVSWFFVHYHKKINKIIM